MDFKKMVEKVKDAAEGLKEKAEAKMKEARGSLDKNQDNIPDAVYPGETLVPEGWRDSEGHYIIHARTDRVVVLNNAQAVVSH